MAELGIACDSDGAHCQPVAEDSPAGILFKQWGLSGQRQLEICVGNSSCH